ncbi:hypothetical protein HC928_11540 [bacterium]|nr:hypothetical protein [bacterium]
MEGWLDGKLLSTIQVTKNTNKEPSPARLYRIAEASRAFWTKIAGEIIPATIESYSFRLELHPEDRSLRDLGGYHAYDLDVDGITLSVIWDKPNKRFLTTDNLDYFAAQLCVDKTSLITQLKGKIVQILEPSSFLQSSKLRATIKIRSARQIVGYRPAILLLAEPTICSMLVPANKALDLAHKVKKEYERQMGRVRDRLPLGIGLVFCKRRTSIRSLLEAGWAMLNVSGQLNMNSGKVWKGWRLINKESSEDFLKLGFESEIIWKIPIVAGDKDTKDEWYPYLYQGDSWERRKSIYVNDLKKSWKSSTAHKSMA